MGYYIETGQVKNKAADICRDHDAAVVSAAAAAVALHQGLGVVCVINNGMFEAAAFIYNDAEFDAFNDDMDPRPRTWLTMDRDKAEQLSNYK